MADNKLSQNGFCKQSIFISERKKVKGGNRLKVAGVCGGGKIVLVFRDWIWKLFLVCNGQLLLHIITRQLLDFPVDRAVDGLFIISWF